MQGLRIDAPQPRRFSRVFAPFIKHIEGRFWFINAQAGPFQITDKPNFEELSRDLETLSVPVPQFENSSETLWNPGVLPLLDEPLLVDEWTYLIGLAGKEGDVVEEARRFSNARWLSSAFFNLLASSDSVFLMHVDGWWEAYSTEQGLMQSLSMLPNVSIVDSHRWSDEIQMIP